VADVVHFKYAHTYFKYAHNFGEIPVYFNVIYLFQRIPGTLNDRISVTKIKVYLDVT